MPNFALERRCKGVVCGIDEAGRGPLAGPVVAAAVILDPATVPRRLKRELDDSKKLSREDREEYLVAGSELIGELAAEIINKTRESIFTRVTSMRGNE